VLTGIFYAALASLGDVAGGALVLWRTGRDRSALAVLSGFGAGFMLAVVLIGMLPEVANQAAAGNAAPAFFAVLIGYLAVHLTQHSLTPHFHFGEETHAVAHGVGIWALAGLLPHSFFDGVAISAGFMESNELGMLIFLAILLHKVPTGVSLVSVTLAGGNTRQQAMLGVLALGAATIAGAAVTPIVPEVAERYGLPLAAGVALYVAASNLIPESQHERSGAVQGGVFGGVAAYLLLEMLH
jgi:ZIP family zinc transporter/zinc and cadmium transporter